MNVNKLKTLSLTALFAAVICVTSPLAIPIGAVPITLATFAVYLSGAVLGTKYGVTAVAVYLAVGAAGAPVFASFSGGVACFAGVTGGFLVGYLPCAFFSGLLPSIMKYKKCSYFIGALIGTVACYAVGTAWFVFETKTGAAAAFAACVLPFLPGDALKITASSLLAPVLKKHLPQSKQR